MTLLALLVSVRINIYIITNNEHELDVYTVSPCMIYPVCITLYIYSDRGLRMFTDESDDDEERPARKRRLGERAAEGPPEEGEDVSTFTYTI